MAKPANKTAPDDYNLTFEKNVPVPPREVGSKYNFRDMPVGASFRKPVDESQKIRAALFNFAKKSGFKFITRTVEEDGKKWIRVWRDA